MERRGSVYGQTLGGVHNHTAMLLSLLIDAQMAGLNLTAAMLLSFLMGAHMAWLNLTVRLSVNPHSLQTRLSAQFQTR